MSPSEWMIGEALTIWEQVSTRLDRHGFLCGVYGSVLRGKGRDLDLMAIPKRGNTSIDFAISDLSSTLGGHCSEPYRGLMGTQSYTLTLPSGKVIDIQFYLPRIAP